MTSAQRFKFLLSPFCFLLFTVASPSATVTGTLNDISIQGLNTKLMFAPTNNVLLTPTGLSAGPPKTINTTNGQFTIVLESGDYTVSLPLIPWRLPFAISVFATNGTVNITNLLAPPVTYTYTNSFINTWQRNGTNIFYSAGKVGIGLNNPSAPLEIRFDSGSNTPKQLLLTSADAATAVGMEFKSPNSADNWQLATISDALKIGKYGVADFLTITSGGNVAIGNTTLNASGSASFASGATLLGDDGSGSFLNGDVSFSATTQIHAKNNSGLSSPDQLLLESTAGGAAGIQFQSTTSTNNWQGYLLNDSFAIGKVGFADFLILNPAGRLNAPFGYAVGASIGISTNMLVLVPGPKTNTFVFTKGILTNIIP